MFKKAYLKIFDLQEHGVILIRVTREKHGKSIETYYLIYRDVIIAEAATETQMQRAIAPFFGKGDKVLLEVLEEFVLVIKSKLANNGRNPTFSVVKESVKKSWMTYLGKRGVKFEIGTQEAIEQLEKHNALGLFVRRNIHPEFNTSDKIIYLYDAPSTGVFLEECYHALQVIEGVPRHHEPITIRGEIFSDFDAWEYLAKKRILENASKNEISYDEYIYLEKHLELVLRNEY